MLQQGTGWQNCEIREFVFTEKSTHSSAHVVEKGVEAPASNGEKKEPHVVKEVEDMGMDERWGLLERAGLARNQGRPKRGATIA